MVLSPKSRNIVDAVILTLLLAMITVSGMFGILFFIVGSLIATLFSVVVVYLVSRIFFASEDLQTLEYSIVSIFSGCAIEMFFAAFFRESGEIMLKSLLSISIVSIIWGRYFLLFLKNNRSR